MSLPDDKNAAMATLGGLYPDLRRITLFIAFEGADATAEPSYQQIIFTSEAAAEFLLGCSRDACIGGGFDFAPIIAEMVSSRETMAHGRLGCGGRLGSEGERCALQAEFRILID